jgi:hypothetical protein
MSENIQADTFSSFQSEPPGAEPPPILSTTSPLPSWVARKILRPHETVSWVRGPRLNPNWERYATHPALILFPLLLGFVALCAAVQTTGSAGVFPAIIFTVAISLPFIFVMGISAGYFTRLVVTDLRLIIVQGYELCWDCDIDYLPPSLLRYDPRRGGKAGRSINLDALQTALGGSSTQFVEAKAILKLAKTIDRIKLRDDNAPDADQTSPDR